MKSFWMMMVIALVVSFAIDANAAKLKATMVNGELQVETIELKAANPRQLQRVVESIGNYKIQEACAAVWLAGGTCYLNMHSDPLNTDLSGAGGNTWAGSFNGAGGSMFRSRDAQRNTAAMYRMQNPGVMMMNRDQATLMYVDAVRERMWTIQVMANIDANSMAASQALGGVRHNDAELNAVREDQRGTAAEVDAVRASSVSQAEVDELMRQIEYLKAENKALSAAILETNPK